MTDHYRVKPAVIRAFQLTKGAPRPDWYERLISDGICTEYDTVSGKLYAQIDTARGVFCVAEGDWIVRQPSGVVEMWLDEAFRERFETVEEARA